MCIVSLLAELFDRLLQRARLRWPEEPEYLGNCFLHAATDCLLAGPEAQVQVAQYGYQKRYNKRLSCGMEEAVPKPKGKQQVGRDITSNPR